MVQGDLQLSADCERIVAETVRRFLRIDVLINNAGVMVQRVPIANLSDQMFDDVFSLNVRSVMTCTKYAIAHMLDGGSIINLTSVAARNGWGRVPAFIPASRALSARIPRAWPRSW
ncbi:MAG: 3-oxoacyl-[acyl-carrier protein] reductase [Rhodoferax sp.]